MKVYKCTECKCHYNEDDLIKSKSYMDCAPYNADESKSFIKEMDETVCPFCGEYNCEIESSLQSWFDSYLESHLDWLDDDGNLKKEFVLMVENNFSKLSEADCILKPSDCEDRGYVVEEY